MTQLTIASRRVGAGAPCFVVAEAGVNHNGDMALAERLVDAAVAAQADAVKFQTFKADRLATRTAPKAAYQLAENAAESQFEMLRRLELPETEHARLQRYCRARGILFLSTPFDEESARFLADLQVPALKIPSGELTNHPMLEAVASLGLPLIVSTGMATLDEVAAAMACLRKAGAAQVALLHCVSNYPANPATVNLRAIQTLAGAFGVPVGYSDHTAGIATALAAVALGACIVEKHFTLDRAMPGPDHRASLEPAELAAMVAGIREVERALGSGVKAPAASEAEVAAVARRSVVAAADIEPGTVLTRELLAIRRPGTGIPPASLPLVIGRRAGVRIAAGTVITEGLLS